MKRTLLIIWILAVLAGTSVAQVPQSNHVVLVVEENHSYSNVIGNSAMPYLNSLASSYGLATQYYANTHPSIGNYFELTTGQVLTNDDNQTPTSFPVSADNIVRQLMVAGKTWKSYAEGLPSVGYTGGDTGRYAVRHNPFAYLTDVQNSSGQKLNLVPFTEFATDLANNQLPNFSYIVPNLDHDAHDGTLQQADTWLQQNIAPLLANPTFQQDGLLIITFDESVDSDTAHGGGHIATLVIGPKAKRGYKSATLYQHQNLLSTLLKALGASTAPGAAASAPAMTDMFTSTTAQTTAAVTASAGVTISSPANGATVASPVRITASAASSNSSYPISAMRIYVDSVSRYTVGGSSVNTSLSLSSGNHNITIVAWDSRGQAYSKSISVNVTGTTTASGVTISSPANGATVSSPVQFVASAASNSSSYPITAMRIYVDNTSKYTTNSASLNTSLALPTGSHNATIVAWDSRGQAYTKSVSFTVGGTTTAGSVTITSPTNGATVNSPVQVVASAKANSGNTITSMRIYVDSTSVYTTAASSLSTSLTMSAGAHNLVVQAWDNTGAVYKASETITVASSTGTGTGTLAANPSALNFGSVNVGNAGSQTVTVTAATAPVTLSKASIAGTGFTVSGPALPITIAAGQSTSFTVKFAPTAAGTASGTLSIASNASNSTLGISLSGTGVAVTTTQHSATLNWSASTSTGVTGYNIYRATQSGGPYTKITGTPVAGTSFTDTNVVAGTTYYYQATAVNNSGMESGDSNSVTATIPAP